MQAIALVADANSPDPFHDLESVIPVTTRQRLLKRAEPWRSSLARCAPGSVGRKGTLPGHRRTLAVRSVCKMVRVVVGEMVFLIGDPDVSARNQRFALAHIQQISMYVCHVVLQLTMTEIGVAHGRDRTTVGHACARVEDRRDGRAFDQLISAVERVVNALFNPIGTRLH
jgi:hypothetical protein